MDISGKDWAIAFSILIVSAAAGFLVSQIGQGTGGDDRFYSSVNHTVDSNNAVETVNFDNHSLNLMYEEGEEARMYIDLDRDGSFDIELDDLKRDGELRSTSQVVTFNRTSYRLSFNYRDNSTAEGDGFLTLYLIQQL